MKMQEIKKNKMKGQWYIITAVLFSFSLLTLFNIFIGYSRVDFTSVLENNEDAIFLNLVGELDKTIENSAGTENLEADISDFFNLVENNLLGKGYFFDYNYIIDGNANITNLVVGGKNLKIKYILPVCGDGILGFGEECENLTNCSMSDFPYRSCTADKSCTNCKCVGNLICNGSTCSKSSSDYCTYCNHCSDGLQNCGEEGVDCGGSCAPCSGNCGDLTCDFGECSSGCVADCNVGDCCGIEGCNPAIGENCSNCPVDCGVCPSCGDGTCDAGECTDGCVADCNVGDCCGIEGCNPAIGENCSNCEIDCGSCTPLPGWDYRRPITLTENSGNSLTNYQVKININYDSDMQPDFDDLRFTNFDGTKNLSYWIESKSDSNWADAWVKVDSLPASSNTIIYMYYGNPSASSASNPKTTFLLYEDWEGEGGDIISQDDFEDRGSIIFQDDFEDGNIDGWTTGGNANWFASTDQAHGGSYSAKSGNIGHNQNTYIQKSITGPATITFYWKVSSESNYDYLRFYVDGVQVWAISGNVGWQKKSYSVQSGSHTIKWSYTKDYSDSSGSDAGWIDDITITDKGLEGWTTGGNRNWYTTDIYAPHGGSWLAKSGDIGHNQNTYIQKSINGPALLHGWWKVSSESGYDYLRKYTDSYQLARISGSSDWSRMGAIIPSGSHTIKWSYTKDYRDSSGSDAGWIDDVKVYQNSNSWATNGNNLWGLHGSGYSGSYSAWNGDIGNGQSSYIYIPLTSDAQMKLTFYWKVSSESNYDYLRFYVDGNQQNMISGSVGWTFQIYTIPSGSHTIKWSYTKDGSESSGSDAGWIDLIKVSKYASPEPTYTIGAEELV